VSVAPQVVPLADAAGGSAAVHRCRRVAAAPGPPGAPPAHAAAAAVPHQRGRLDEPRGGGACQKEPQGCCCGVQRVPSAASVVSRHQSHLHMHILQCARVTQQAFHVSHWWVPMCEVQSIGVPLSGCQVARASQHTFGSSFRSGNSPADITTPLLMPAVLQFYACVVYLLHQRLLVITQASCKAARVWSFDQHRSDAAASRRQSSSSAVCGVRR
jgi:hypothetical protein